MKYLYPLCLLLFLAGCQKDEKKETIDREKTDWAFYNLKGDVKTISTKSFAVANSAIGKGTPRHENPSDRDSDLTFNEKGMLVKEKLWKGGIQPFSETTYEGRDRITDFLQYINGKPGVKTQYLWDKDGNNITITKRNADNTPLNRVEMKYKKGNMIEKITYNAQNNPIDKKTYVYDDKGNKIGEAIYMRSEYIQYKIHYKYDTNNKLIEEAQYDKEGKLLYRTTYKHNGDNLISTETFNDKGELEYSEKFSFDKNGNMISRVAYEKFENAHTVEKYQYDSANNKTMVVVSKNDVPLFKVSYKYDDKNNLIASHAFDRDDKPRESRAYTYKYDDKGNWTEKIVSIAGKPSFVVERSIKYFE